MGAFVGCRPFFDQSQSINYINRMTTLSMFMMCFIVVKISKEENEVFFQDTEGLSLKTIFDWPLHFTSDITPTEIDLVFYERLFNHNTCVLQHMKQHLSSIHILNESLIFKRHLQHCHEEALLERRKGTSENANVNLTCVEVIELCWIPGYERMHTYIEKVRLGNLTIQEALTDFEDWSAKWSDLKAEFRKLVDNEGEGWITTRIEQLQQIFKLSSYKQAAELVLKLKTTFDLKGDFSVTDDILDLESNFDKQLNTFTDVKLGHFKLFESLTGKGIRMDALQAFDQARPFVDWVTAHLPADHLKTFYDLGQLYLVDSDDLEKQRLHNFYMVATGYEHLIYSLKRNFGLTELLEACKILWTKLDEKGNEHLVESLKKVSNSTEWLEKIRENQGSIEKDTLRKIKEINAHGVFRIGKLHKRHENVHVSDNIELEVNIENELMEYTYDRVKDLQDKMMLLVGQSREKLPRDVSDRFLIIFNAVTQLRDLYQSLCLQGNLLFREMVLTVHCYETCENPIEIDFQLSRKCLTSNSENLTEDLASLVNNLKTCLTEWQDLVTEKRNCYRELNYFTCEQITFLQMELCCLFNGDGKTPDWRVYPLLKSYRQDLSFETLRDSLAKLFERQKAKTEKLSGDEETRNHAIKQGQRQKCFEEIFSEIQKDNSSLAILTRRYWEAYKTHCNVSFREIVCMDDVAELIAIVRKVDDTRFNFGTIPVKQHQANLIVCKKNDMVPTMLTFYKKFCKKLPTSEFVLYCDTSTSIETVELFLRRALFDDEANLYCMLHVECLSYQVSLCAEKIFLELRELRSAVIESCLVAFVSDSQRKLSPLCNALQESDVDCVGLSEDLIRWVQSQLGGREPKDCQVLLVASKRNGMGKSLCVERLAQDAQCDTVTFAWHRKNISVDDFTDVMFEKLHQADTDTNKVIHLDLAREVDKGLESFLLNLCIFGSVTDSKGFVWHRSSSHRYIIEHTPALQFTGDELCWKHAVLKLLPCVNCLSPAEIRSMIEKKKELSVWQRGVDPEKLNDNVFLKAISYLVVYDEYKTEFNDRPNEVSGEQCLDVALEHFKGIEKDEKDKQGKKDPSWQEVHNFFVFMNQQLRDFEGCPLLTPVSSENLPQLGDFVMRFLILMSEDFAQPSLNISDESDRLSRGHKDNSTEKTEVGRFSLDRTWESSSHPYLFFNNNGCLVFMGFIVDHHYFLVNVKTGQHLKPNRPFHIAPELFHGLSTCGIPLNEDFDSLDRDKKIQKICDVMCVRHSDSSQSYELTADNAKKILAIYMRFRCSIPVIIMGETGCGKTRLIRFMCELQRSSVGNPNSNLIIVKVHGGTTEDDIIKKVKLAVQKSIENKAHEKSMETVLFLDEVNSTEAIGLVKEILIDGRMRGEKIDFDHGLRVVAACNPYRRLSDKMIEKLESSGLGYKVRQNETKDLFGSVPMRQLVYRVQPLPNSLRSLVWDFGTLTEDVEEKYILQMMKNINDSHHFDEYRSVIAELLIAVHSFMRKLTDEYFFVSLRDVERFIKVLNWFWSHRGVLFRLMDDRRKSPACIAYHSQAVILSLGVCYHIGLNEHRGKFVEDVVEHFKAPLSNVTPENFEKEIRLCQSVFLDGVNLKSELVDRNIARNQALLENVFMMVICIDLRIPLFIVGKPGSSKSLAKTVVTDAMKGSNSGHEFFRCLKEAHCMSFQCSPLSTAEGIENTFEQCANIQQQYDENKVVGVVVLDEVGLAEDSEKMPLKVLHPLLESGCLDEDNEPNGSASSRHVGFIGISNWALDPAKMNRGLRVERGTPDTEELVRSAKKICSSKKDVRNNMETLFIPLAKGYEEIVKASTTDREYFGLRDYFSLIKMLFAFAERHGRPPIPEEIKHAIRRNFGGFVLERNSEDYFFEHLKGLFSKIDLPDHDESFSTWLTVIKEAIQPTMQFENIQRYPLFLTENNSGLRLLIGMLDNKSKSKGENKPDSQADNTSESKVENKSDSQVDNTSESKVENKIGPIVLYGSSFPHDLEYTQLCRDINKIKVSMENGGTIILLNMDQLYESLYDVLNQYYISCGKDHFVDLGLGTHRLKCKVSKSFRLIVVAERELVLKTFPVPLINRLEKHFWNNKDLMSQKQQSMCVEVETWMDQFCTLQPSMASHEYQNIIIKKEDVFVGYHSDAVVSIVMENTCLDKDAIIERLLLIATPESLARLDQTLLANKKSEYQKIYFEKQKHLSLEQCLKDQVSRNPNFLLQITTHDRCLSESDLKSIENTIEQKILLKHLAQFHTEAQFEMFLKEYFESEQKSQPQRRVFILQCEATEKNHKLVTCAKYLIQKVYSDAGCRGRVVVVVQLTRSSNFYFNGFEVNEWQCVHIEELVPFVWAELSRMDNRSVSVLLREERGDSAEHVLDVPYLLETCIPEAAVLLRDKEGVPCTERIDFVRDLLGLNENERSNKHSPSKFRDILLSHLSHLQQEKEEKIGGSIVASYWFGRDAAKLRKVAESGTFR